MGRTVYAEENLLDYLKNLSSENTPTVGILIGQSTSAADYVFHMSKSDGVTFNTVKDIKAAWIKQHVNVATERLPGGLSVLGIFICSPTEIFNDKSMDLPLKRLVDASIRAKKDELYNSLHDEPEELVFHYDPVNQKYICKSAPLENALTQFKQADWKFKKNCTKWCQISSKFGLNFPPIAGKMALVLQKAIMKFSSHVNETILNSVVMIGDKVLHQDQNLQSIIKAGGKKKIINDNEIQVLDASIYISLSGEPEAIAAMPSELIQYGSKYTVDGCIKSDAFISENATAEEAVRAVKIDISRSLAARIRFHLDSLVEEPEETDQKEDKTIHEPPRRVLVSIPNSPLCFTEYVFPEEDCVEIMRMFQLFMDVKVTEKDVNKTYEVHSDLSKFRDSTKKKLASKHSDDLLGSTLPSGFHIAAISFALILIAIAIALRMQRSASPDEKTR